MLLSMPDVRGRREPCGTPAAGDVKEFGFRGVPSGPVPPEAELPPLQPVPVLAPGMVADPRLALTIGVSGSIANAQVQRLAGTQNDYVQTVLPAAVSSCPGVIC